LTDSREQQAAQSAATRQLGRGSADSLLPRAQLIAELEAARARWASVCAKCAARFIRLFDSNRVGIIIRHIHGNVRKATGLSYEPNELVGRSTLITESVADRWGRAAAQSYSAPNSRLIRKDRNLSGHRSSLRMQGGCVTQSSERRPSMKRSLAIVAILMAPHAGLGRADAATIHTTHADGTRLGTIDTASGVGTDIGPFGTTQTWAAAFDTDGTLYTTTDGFTGNATLATVNLATGAVTPIGGIGINLISLEVAADGTMYGVGFDDGVLYSINKGTGAPTPIGNTGIVANMDLAFDSSGTLWATVSDNLWTLNLATGAATPQPPITGVVPAGSVMGIMFDAADTLYATSYIAGSSLYTVDTTTGVATPVGNTGFDFPHGGDIYLLQQPLACPGDCAIPPNKVVDIVDFLALLAQWGGPGTCDLNKDGVVNIQDFLLMLAVWGPCPTPANDECLGQEPIHKTDPEGLTTVHFDMWGATPSPEPYKCLAEPPIHKDIWYCLTNGTDQTIGVTITTNIPLFIDSSRSTRAVSVRRGR
jgi:hypothetical protein